MINTSEIYSKGNQFLTCSTEDPFSVDMIRYLEEEKTIVWESGKRSPVYSNEISLTDPVWSDKSGIEIWRAFLKTRKAKQHIVLDFKGTGRVKMQLKYTDPNLYLTLIEEDVFDKRVRVQEFSKSNKLLTLDLLPPTITSVAEIIKFFVRQ